jgi:hypothetical protein
VVSRVAFADEMSQLDLASKHAIDGIKGLWGLLISLVGALMTDASVKRLWN